MSHQRQAYALGHKRRQSVHVFTDVNLVRPNVVTRTPSFANHESPRFVEYHVSPRTNHHATPRAPSPPPAAQSPRFHKLHRRASYARERNVDVIALTTDGAALPVTPPRRVQIEDSSDDDDTVDELARFYQQQSLAGRGKQLVPAHRPRSRNELSLIPVGSRDITTRDGVYIIDRDPVSPYQPKPKKKQAREERHAHFETKVIEHKQTAYMRDSKGQWVRIRRVLKA